MIKEIKGNSTYENCFIYFPYFNHQLYENPSNIQEEENLSKSDADNQSLEDSSTNISNETNDSISDEEKYIPLNLLDLSPIKTSYTSDESKIPKPQKLFDLIDLEEKTKNESQVKEIKPDLQKYKLPKSLFETNKDKKSEKEVINYNKNSAFTSLSNTKLNLLSQSYIPKYKIVPFIIYNNVTTCFSNSIGNKFGQLPLNFNRCNFQKIKSDKNKKKKKQEFMEREGDWSCYRCKNINFSFRNKCNKCLLSKDESEKKFVEIGEALLKLADLSIYDKKNKDECK